MIAFWDKGEEGFCFLQAELLFQKGVIIGCQFLIVATKSCLGTLHRHPRSATRAFRDIDKHLRLPADRRNLTSRETKVGVILPIYKTGFPRLVEIAQLCEKLRLDSIWVYDHMFWDGEDLFEGWTTLSALAPLIKHITLGTLVLRNAFRSPSLLAKMTATVNSILDGRLILGLGVGDVKADVEAYGIPFPDLETRIGMLAETIEILRLLWTGEPVDFNGKYHRLEHAICTPKNEHLPRIWVGGLAPRMVRLAASAADGWNAWNPSLDKFQKRADLFRRSIQPGRQVDVSAEVTMIVGKSDEDVKHKLEDYEKRGGGQFDGVKLAGTVEECAKKLGEYRDAGVEHFVLSLPGGRNPETLTLIAEELVPRIKGS